MRNKALDLLRIPACIFVMIIHFSFPFIGGPLIAIAQYAVPFFFMISGYFCANKEPKKILKQAWKTSKLLLIAFFATIIVGVLSTGLSYGGNGIKNYLLDFLDWKRILTFLWTNDLLCNYSLWFMPALIYCYLIYALIRKCGLNKKIYYIVAVLLLITEFILGGVLSLFSVSTGIHLRNFLFIGIPFFALGGFIKDFEKEILEKTSKKGLCILFIIGVIESLGSAYFRQTLFLGSLFIAFSLFVLSLKIEVKSNAFLDVLSQCSVYVYIFHVLVYRVFVEIIFSRLGWTSLSWWGLVDSIIAMSLTFLISVCIIFLQKALKKKEKKKDKQTA